MSEKILVFSDLHCHNYGSFSKVENGVNSRLLDCLKVMDQVIEVAQDCKLVVFAGDVFERTPPPVEVFNRTFDKFEQLASGREVLCVAGNHDLSSRSFSTSEELSFLKFNKIPGVKIFECSTLGSVRDVGGKQISIQGFGYRHRGEVVKELGNLPEDLDLLVLHDEVRGASLGHFIFPTGLDVEYLSKLARWTVVGHIHHPQQFDNVIIPGSSLQHKFGENHDKYLWLWDVGEDTWEKVPTKFPRFVTVPDMSEVDEDGNFYREIVVKQEKEHVEVSSPDKALEEYCKQKGREDHLALGREILGQVDSKEIIPSTFRLCDIHIKNFLSVGDITLNFKEKDGVWLVVGSKDGDERVSNGTGKTSTFEAIYWVLYGKTTKGLKGDDVVGNQGKSCFVEAHLEDKDGHTLCVIRSRHHPKLGTTLRFHYDETLVQGSKMDKTQKELESYLGVSASFFLQMVYFSQERFEFFSEMADSGRKGLLSDLLGLGQYESAKSVAKKELDGRQNKLVRLSSEVGVCEGRIDDFQTMKQSIRKRKALWEEERATRVQQLKDKVTELGKEMEGLDQERAKLVEQVKELYGIERELEKIDEELSQKEVVLQGTTEKHRSFVSAMQVLSARAEEKHILCQRIEGLKEGSSCDMCGSLITNENKNQYLALVEKDLVGFQDEHDRVQKKADVLFGEIQEVKKEIQKLKDCRRGWDCKKSQLVDITNEIGKIEIKFESLVREKKTWQDRVDFSSFETNPHNASLKEAETKLKEKKKELKSIEKEIEVVKKELGGYEFWVTGFGFEGVPALLLGSFCGVFSNEVNGVLSRVGSDISVSLSPCTSLKSGDRRDRLDYRIKMNGLERPYGALSGGEKSRVDVAGLLSLNAISSRQYGIEGGLLGISILDEVLGALDDVGKEGVRMILSEAPAKSAFVITHDGQFKEMFDNVLHVDMREGVTHLVS